MPGRSVSSRSSFNSRLREEATWNKLERVREYAVSTHASVRRRQAKQFIKPIYFVFQLTPP